MAASFTDIGTLRERLAKAQSRNEDMALSGGFGGGSLPARPATGGAESFGQAPPPAPDKPMPTGFNGARGISSEITKPKTGTTNPAVIAANIAKQDSALMQQADTKGRAFANSRGLLNSSLTAGAAQAATLDYVVPLAQQEAAQRHERARGFEDYKYGASLSEQDYRQTYKLSDQDFRNQMGMSKEQYRQDLVKQQRQITAEKDLAKMDADSRMGLAGMDADVKMSIAKWQKDADQSDSVANMVGDMQTMYQDEVRTIMANGDIDAEDRTEMIDAAKANLDKRMAMIQQVYKVDIKW